MEVSSEKQPEELGASTLDFASRKQLFWSLRQNISTGDNISNRWWSISLGCHWLQFHYLQHPGLCTWGRLAGGPLILRGKPRDLRPFRSCQTLPEILSIKPRVFLPLNHQKWLTEAFIATSLCLRRQNWEPPQLICWCWCSHTSWLFDPFKSFLRYFSW